MIYSDVARVHFSVLYINLNIKRGEVLYLKYINLNLQHVQGSKIIYSDVSKYGVILKLLN
jgi:hypothetical protein